MASLDSTYLSARPELSEGFRASFHIAMLNGGLVS